MRRRRIPEGVIKIHLPGVQQKKWFSCGAAVIQTIMGYFGVGPIEQSEYVEALGTNSSAGTPPNKIIKFAQNHGLRVKTFKNMTLEQLKKNIDKCRPVLCIIQAWGDPQRYDRNLSGHYVIAVGYDEKYIYFEDPSIEAYRGYLTYSEFEYRWHDEDSSKKIYNRFGVVIWMSGSQHYLRRAIKIE